MGEPFGPSIVVPAVRLCQFDLGTVVVRAAIYVDPHTPQATDASGPFPTIIDVISNRHGRSTKTSTVPGFTFNPTNCKPMSVTGTVTGVEGASAAVSSRFQVTSCNRLQTITSNSLKQTSNHKELGKAGT